MKRFIRRNADLFIPAAIFFTGMIIMVFLMVQFEKTTIFDGIWYSIVTATTLGYGVITPKIVLVKMYALLYILTSIGSLTALITAIVFRVKQINRKRRLGMISYRRNPDLIIVGYPTEAKVQTIVKEIKKLWDHIRIVCITNQIQEKPEWMSDEGVFFVQGRASERAVLELANVKDAKNILILANDPTNPESDEYTSSAVMMCEKINPNAHTIAEKVRDNDDLFQWASCDKVVDVCRPSELVHEILHAGAIDFIDTLFSPDTKEVMKNIKTPINGSWQAISNYYLQRGMIAVGASTNGGKSFEFAPALDIFIEAGNMIKVITKEN